MLTSKLIAAAAGIVLSLALSHIPPLNEKWEMLTGRGKRAALAAIMIAVTAASIAFGCAGIFAQYATECSQTGIESAIMALFAAFGSSQAAYVFTGGADSAEAKPTP